jgi:hypothetical protein
MHSSSASTPSGILTEFDRFHRATLIRACAPLLSRGARLVRIEYQSENALEELRAFVAVVDAQGFRAAAPRNERT